MSFAAIALLTALGGSVQDQPAPRPETRSEVRIVRADVSSGPGRLDANGDGEVTREEFVSPLASAFDRMDTNGDGRLSAEELAAGGRGDGTTVSHIFTTGDLAGLAGGAGSPGEPRVMILDGSGGPGSVQTSSQVFRIGRDGVEGLPGGSGQSHVFVRRFGGPNGASDMDKDGDGRVSEEEFLAPLRDAFRSMDTDGDGFVDAGAIAPAPPARPAPARR